MAEEEKIERLAQLRAVIAWALECQRPMRRTDDGLATLLADSIMDYFDIGLRPGADVTVL